MKCVSLFANIKSEDGKYVSQSCACAIGYRGHVATLTEELSYHGFEIIPNINH